MSPLKKILAKQLGELLIERAIINQKQLEKALEMQKEKGGLIGEILVELGFAKEEDIAHALTAQYGFPYLPLGNYEIDYDTARIINENIARQYCLICIDKLGNNITLAMSNPLNSDAIEDIEMITGSKVQIFVSTASDIKKAIDRCYKA
ncbi:MAG: hypothetical protein V1674_07140 [Candidatus Omnitrophota bacterium]